MRRFLTVIALSILTATSAPGQFFPLETGGGNGRFIGPPRSISQQLRIAGESIQERRYGDAVVVLGDLLQRRPTGDEEDGELAGQDFFLDADESGTVVRVDETLIAAARRMMNNLPADAIATYELRYGAEARKTLDEAAKKRRWDDVTEVRRRFFHTAAGRDATGLMIRHAISLGEVTRARRLIDALTQHPTLSASAHGELLALLESLPSGGAASDDEKSLSQETDPQTRFASIKPRRQRVPIDYRMFDGHHPAPGVAGGQLPLADPRYTVDTTGSSRQERTLRESTDTMSAVGELPPPSSVPLRVGNQILMRTTERLVGVDFENGKRIWEYPWFKTDNDIESSELAMDGMPDEESGSSLLKQRVWNDLPYGRMSSDGTRVFVLGDLAQVQVAAFSPLMGMQGTRPADTKTNSLIALDLATEGKLVWQIGGDLPADDALAGAFILGAPLPVGDALYVMIELSGDILLVCLDPETGTQRWRQQLLAVESGGIDTDPVRRVAGASAAYHDGVLICNTGAGAIVAVDVEDRSLMWGVTIDRNDAIKQTMLTRRDGFIPDQLMKRWWDGTPTIIDETIFVTPIESDRLFALDLLTGEKRWPEVARAQTGSRYMAGVQDGTIVLVGSDNVRGLNASTGTTKGRKTWKTRGGWLDATEYVSGLGTFGVIENPVTGDSEPAYFVPTTSNRIIAVSLRDGSALVHRTVSFPAGNLVSVDGQIISQSPTLLSVAFGQASLEPRVAAALQDNPNDVALMVQKAQLLIEQDKRGEALTWLNKARAIKPDDDDVRVLSIRAMLGALREDFTNNADLLATLDLLIESPVQRAELLKLQVRASLDRTQPLAAVGRLLELSKLISEESTLSTQSSPLENEPSRFVSMDSWIGARAAEAVTLADDDTRESIASTIAAYLDPFASASVPRLQRLVQQFGAIPGSDSLVRQLVKRYVSNGQWLAMERAILAAGETTPDHLEKLTTWQATAVAIAYADGGLRPDADAALTVAMKDDSDDAARAAAASLGRDLDNVLAASRGGRSLGKWEGKLSVVLPNEPIVGRIAANRRINVGENKRVVGQSFRGWQLVSEDSSPVAMRDPLGIVRPILVDNVNRREETQRQSVISGGLMIAILPGELVAVNLFDLVRGQADPVLWRRAWRTEGTGSGFRRKSESTSFGDLIFSYVVSSGGNGSVASEMHLGPIVGDTFYLLQGTELIALDAITQTPRWRNTDAPRDGMVVCDGSTVAVVSPSSNAILKYDCRDGRRIGEDPFTDYKLWASTDQSVLMYRDLPEGKRELRLLNPITGETLLEHTFTGIGPDKRVFGRIVEGNYVVTLATDGETLIWDLKNARVVTESKTDPIPRLSGLHVMPRHDSVVLLPVTTESTDDSANFPITTTSGEAHVRVDTVAFAVDTQTGAVQWSCPLGDESWGCTLSQSSVSPVVLLSRGRSKYLTTGSRLKTLDVLAIDTRDGSTLPSMDIPVDSFNNEIETRLTVQPPQSRVLVNIGPMMLDYAIGDRVITPPNRDLP